MRQIRRAVFAAVLATSFVASGPVSAHDVGESYLFLELEADQIRARVEARLEDLDAAVPIDANHDGKVTDAELETALASVQDYVASRLSLTADGAPVDLRVTGHDLLVIDLGRYVQISFAGSPGVEREISIDYSLLFDELPDQRGMLVIDYDHRTGERNETEAVSLVFTPDHRSHTLELGRGAGWAGFVLFVKEGVWHIWIGLDHILFLLALILPAVLRRVDGRWEAVTDFRAGLMNVVKIVTIFTVAHSVTLSLAALDLVRLDSRVVESVIAASVVVAAVNSAFVGRKIWPVIFAFGLFHGFGFASVLGHLTFDRRAILPALLGFNVGVELGQITIVAAIFPILWLARQWRRYPALVLRFGSGIIATLALVWFVERAFGVTLLGF
ncbi:MAG: HupE/UreJ family protein [bacterium]